MTLEFVEIVINGEVSRNQYFTLDEHEHTVKIEFLIQVSPFPILEKYFIKSENYLDNQNLKLK